MMLITSRQPEKPMNQFEANMVKLPPPNEGQEIVAAFRQPIPMQGMSRLLKAIAECYGQDAKLIPTGDWLAISGTLCNKHRAATPAPTTEA